MGAVDSLVLADHGGNDKWVLLRRRRVDIVAGRDETRKVALRNPCTSIKSFTNGLNPKLSCRDGTLSNSTLLMMKGRHSKAVTASARKYLHKP